MLCWHLADMASCLCRTSGADLWTKMQNSWGYLGSKGQGYLGHVFPVVVGETGSEYLTVGQLLGVRDDCVFRKRD